MKTLIKILCLSVLWFSCEDNTSPHGCLDSEACNYNPNATINNNSCIYKEGFDGECFGNAKYDFFGQCGGNASENDCSVLVDFCQLNEEFTPAVIWNEFRRIF